MSTSEFIAGVDPGKTGGYGIFNCHGKLAFAAPLDFDRPDHLQFDLDRFAVTEIVIERAQAAKEQAGQFEYGRAFGRVEAVAMLSGARVFYCSPVWWKSRLGVPVDKTAAYAMACRRFPGLAAWAPPGPRGGLDRVHGTAEGCLIGSTLLVPRLRLELEKNNAARTAKPTRRRPTFQWKGD